MPIAAISKSAGQKRVSASVSVFDRDKIGCWLFALGDPKDSKVAKRSH